jgi:hypothetical protein
MECNGNCQEFCSWIKTLPCHVRYTLPRECIPELPECFHETILGEMMKLLTEIPATARAQAPRGLRRRDRHRTP